MNVYLIINLLLSGTFCMELTVDSVERKIHIVQDEKSSADHIQKDISSLNIPIQRKQNDLISMKLNPRYDYLRSSRLSNKWYNPKEKRTYFPKNIRKHSEKSIKGEARLTPNNIQTIEINLNDKDFNSLSDELLKYNDNNKISPQNFNSKLGSYGNAGGLKRKGCKHRYLQLFGSGLKSEHVIQRRRKRSLYNRNDNPDRKSRASQSYQHNPDYYSSTDPYYNYDNGYTNNNHNNHNYHTEPHGSSREDPWVTVVNEPDKKLWVGQSPDGNHKWWVQVEPKEKMSYQHKNPYRSTHGNTHHEYNKPDSYDRSIKSSAAKSSWDSIPSSSTSVRTSQSPGGKPITQVWKQVPTDAKSRQSNQASTNWEPTHNFISKNAYYSPEEDAKYQNNYVNPTDYPASLRIGKKVDPFKEFDESYFSKMDEQVKGVSDKDGREGRDYNTDHQLGSYASPNVYQQQYGSFQQQPPQYGYQTSPYLANHNSYDKNNQYNQYPSKDVPHYHGDLYHSHQYGEYPHSHHPTYVHPPQEHHSRHARSLPGPYENSPYLKKYFADSNKRYHRLNDMARNSSSYKSGENKKKEQILDDPSAKSYDTNPKGTNDYHYDYNPYQSVTTYTPTNEPGERSYSGYVQAAAAPDVYPSVQYNNAPVYTGYDSYDKTQPQGKQSSTYSATPKPVAKSGYGDFGGHGGYGHDFGGYGHGGYGHGHGHGGYGHGHGHGGYGHGHGGYGHDSHGYGHDHGYGHKDYGKTKKWDKGHYSRGYGKYGTQGDNGRYHSGQLKGKWHAKKHDDYKTKGSKVKTYSYGGKGWYKEESHGYNHGYGDEHGYKQNYHYGDHKEKTHANQKPYHQYNTKLSGYHKEHGYH